jgi:VanZ family protein
VISKKRVLGILCILMVSGLLFVGLWPFDPSPKNRAYWIPNQEGLYFDGHLDRWKLSVGGIAYTPSPLRSQKPAPQEKASFTIEIVLKPAVEINSSVPHILGFIDSSEEEAFYLGQWKQSLIVRWFTYDQRGKRWLREIGVRDALIKGKAQRLTLVSNGTTCSIYLNGQLAKSFQGVSLMSEKESIRGCSLVLGNSREVKSPWTGTVLALKVYERALSEPEIAKDRSGGTEDLSYDGLMASYALDKSHTTLVPDLSGNRNALSVPERVTLTNSILAWPDWRNQKDSSPLPDVAVNILGFVPFGFLFAFWREQMNGSRRWAGFLLAVLVVALISLAIEVTQAFIPARDSNMVDVICNTAGTILGAGFWVLGSGFWEQKPKAGRQGSQEAKG